MNPINKTWTMIICCTCLFGFAPMASASFAQFMLIEGMPGESQDTAHPGWIDVLSTEWSLDATASADKRGSVGEISDIVITIAADASSPYLALAAMQSKSFDTVDFEFVDDTGQVVRTLRLTNVKITSLVSSTQDRSIPPTETLALNYERIVWVAYPADREQAPTEFVWTRAGN